MPSSSSPSGGHTHTSPPFDSGFLAVGDIHKIHYEQYGNPKGAPVIFLHGGPGNKTTVENTYFFNSTFWRVVLLDQRGAGKSEPAAEIRENTSQHLVSDIETLREHLNIEKWSMVFGGSWGSCLAILYAQTHPEAVGSLVMRGIFTARSAENEWQKHPNGGAPAMCPEYYAEFINFLPPEFRGSYNDIYKGYFHLLTGTGVSAETRKKAAYAWNKWEAQLVHLVPQEGMFDRLEDERWSLQVATMECLYEMNGCFLEEGQLLKDENMAKIKHIPCSIVQGRYDLDCPPKTAWDLHQKWPGSRLFMINDGGHSEKEPGIRQKMLECCDDYVAGKWGV